MDYVHENGFEVVSITADDVETLKRFAARRKSSFLFSPMKRMKPLPPSTYSTTGSRKAAATTAPLCRRWSLSTPMAL
jgi:hypothetical protein